MTGSVCRHVCRCAGSLGKFDFTTLLIQLTASLALLSMVRTPPPATYLSLSALLFRRQGHDRLLMWGCRPRR